MSIRSAISFQGEQSPAQLTTQPTITDALLVIAVAKGTRLEAGAR